MFDAEIREARIQRTAESIGKAGLPDGWTSGTYEFFVFDWSHIGHAFAFDVSLATKAGGGVQPWATCRICGSNLNPDKRSLRRHAYKHVFPQIPFDAPADL